MMMKKKALKGVKPMMKMGGDAAGVPSLPDYAGRAKRPGGMKAGGVVSSSEERDASGRAADGSRAGIKNMIREREERTARLRADLDADNYMREGGASSRNGYPTYGADKDETRRYAKGGRVRGCGAATKGKTPLKVF